MPIVYIPLAAVLAAIVLVFLSAFLVGCGMGVKGRIRERYPHPFERWRGQWGA